MILIHLVKPVQASTTVLTTAFAFFSLLVIFILKLASFYFVFCNCSTTVDPFTLLELVVDCACCFLPSLTPTL